MKKLLLNILLFCVSFSYATDIRCVGKATQVAKGKDTLFIFRDEIHLRANTHVDWYAEDGALIASNTDEIYPDEGVFRVGAHRFIAMKYKDLDSLSFTIEPSCNNTILRITGVDDFMSRAHTYTLYYNALAWNGEAWADSAVVDSGALAPAISLPPLYGATSIRLCYDCAVRAALGMDSACVEAYFAPDDVQAVHFKLTSLATARENDPNGNNERNKPIEQDIIKSSSSSDWSGPLEVAFYSNPTPGVKYYSWSVYKATERIVTRQDENIRYTFSEPGSYRVVCAVNNQYCVADSMEMVVAISESALSVPNVFTPNGDGINDEFRVSYRSLKEFHCWVYNRWGKLVYEWTDPSKGWDGMIGGRPASEGAYFYVIRALGTDAAKDAGYTMKAVYNKKKLNADEAVIGVYQMSGDINLLR